MNKWKIKNIITITRPETSEEEWDGCTGRINKEMISANVDKGSVFYLCGPNEMVDGLREALDSIGVASNAILCSANTESCIDFTACKTCPGLVKYCITIDIIAVIPINGMIFFNSFFIFENLGAITINFLAKL